MLKGCFQKLKGLIYLFKEMTYRIFCHVVHTAMVSKVQLALVSLNQNNPFYQNIKIDIDNISDELPDLTEDIDRKIPICVESNEEGENSLYSYILNPEKTILISQMPTSEKISITLGQGKKPSLIL